MCKDRSVSRELCETIGKALATDAALANIPPNPDEKPPRFGLRNRYKRLTGRIPGHRMLDQMACAYRRHYRLLLHAGRSPAATAPDYVHVARPLLTVICDLSGGLYDILEDADSIPSVLALEGHLEDGQDEDGDAVYQLALAGDVWLPDSLPETTLYAITTPDHGTPPGVNRARLDGWTVKMVSPEVLQNPFAPPPQVTRFDDIPF